MTTTVYLHPNALLTQRFPTPATVPHQPDHYRGLGIPELEVELVLAPELVLVSVLVSELVSVSVSVSELVSELQHRQSLHHFPRLNRCRR